MAAGLIKIGREVKWEIKCKTTAMSCLSTTWRLRPASPPRCHHDCVVAARVFYFGVSGSQSAAQLAWFQHQPPSVLHHATSDRSRSSPPYANAPPFPIQSADVVFIRSILLLLDRQQMETRRSRFCCKCQLSAAVGRSGDPDQEDAGLIGPKQATSDSLSSLSR